MEFSFLKFRKALVLILTAMLLHFSHGFFFNRDNRTDLNKMLIAHCGASKKCIKKKYHQCFGDYFDFLSFQEMEVCLGK